MEAIQRVLRVTIGLRLSQNKTLAELVAAIGLRAQQKFTSRGWSSNNRPNECRLFTIGKTMIDKVRRNVDQHVKRIRQATTEAAANWG